MLGGVTLTLAQYFTITAETSGTGCATSVNPGLSQAGELAHTTKTIRSLPRALQPSIQPRNRAKFCSGSVQAHIQGSFTCHPKSSELSFWNPRTWVVD